MRQGNAARRIEPPSFMQDGGRREEVPAAPPSEESRYEPKFRVVSRKPLTPRRRATGTSLQRSLVWVVVPAVCLLVYVMFWTMAIRGGYYRDKLQAQLHQTRLQRAELEAEKQRLASPGRILDAARKMGMVAPTRREFPELGVSRPAVSGGVAE